MCGKAETADVLAPAKDDNEARAILSTELYRLTYVSTIGMRVVYRLLRFQEIVNISGDFAVFRHCLRQKKFRI